MSRLKRFIPTPAMVVAMTALVIALGGTGYAAVSVGGPSSGGSDQKAGPTKAGSLAQRGPRGPRGPRGFRGARGPAGPQGPAGTNGTNGTNGAANVVVRSSNIPEGTGQGQVNCNAGEKATGGGGTGNGPEVYLRGNEPVPKTGTPTGWLVSFKRLVPGGSNQNAGGTAYVICVSP